MHGRAEMGDLRQADRRETREGRKGKGENSGYQHKGLH